MGDYWLRRLWIANEKHKKHTVACYTMNIHMQRQTTGMPYLLKDKQCIQQIKHLCPLVYCASGHIFQPIYRLYDEHFCVSDVLESPSRT